MLVRVDEYEIIDIEIEQVIKDDKDIVIVFSDMKGKKKVRFYDEKVRDLAFNKIITCYKNGYKCCDITMY